MGRRENTDSDLGGHGPSLRLRRSSVPDQVVDLGGADEVVDRDPADAVGAVLHRAAVEADDQLRVVVLAVRDPGHGVDEGHGLVVVLEREGLGQLTSRDRPALGVAEQSKDDPTSRFVLVRRAWELAGEAGAIDRAFEVVDKAAEWYRLDSLACKTDILRRADKVAARSPSAVFVSRSIAQSAEGHKDGLWTTVVAAGIWLPFVGKALAESMGWHQTFVGTLFVAVATSLPEAVVTISALRIGALDMAVSNLLGSNLFNGLLVAVDDLLYLKGPILADVSPLHGLSALSAIMMNGVAIIGLLFRPRERLLHIMGWTSLMIFSLYLLNTLLLYLHGE